MAETRDTYMPPRELFTDAAKRMPKFKPELCRVGARVIALDDDVERRGTVSYVANWNAIIRPDDQGCKAFKVNLRNILRKAPPLGEMGYRGQVRFTHRARGVKVTFSIEATATAKSGDEACQRIMTATRLVFPTSCERQVFGVTLDDGVVG
jgi:hypothetical protein